MSSLPRRIRTPNNFNFDSSTTANSGSVAPTSDGATFRDLLIFEERLKQNAARLQRRKHKYQGLLLLLCSAILLLSYHVLLSPKPQHPLVHYAQLVSLVVCGTTLFLFFASGMYAERIVAANRFVPQANRALRSFNMYLNTRRPSASNSWLASLPFWGSSALQEGSPAAASASASVTSFSSSKSMQFPATSIASNGHSTRLVRDAPDPTNPSALPPVRRMQIQPIPPSSNPRGEMIFSSKVSPAFREGYERYRNAFERRRKEKLDAADMEGRMKWRWRRWLFAIRGGTDFRQHNGGESGLEAGSGVGTPTTTRRGVIVSDKGSGAGPGTNSTTLAGSRSKASSTTSTGHRKTQSRHQHRSRTDSSASIASTASNSTTFSAHGHGSDATSAPLGPSAATATAATATATPTAPSSASSSSPPTTTSKRRSSPRRKVRESSLAGPSSLRRSSLSPDLEAGAEEERAGAPDGDTATTTTATVTVTPTINAPSVQAPHLSGCDQVTLTSDQSEVEAEPSSSRDIANSADWRGDPKTTLREPVNAPLSLPSPLPLPIPIPSPSSSSSSAAPPIEAPPIQEHLPKRHDASIPSDDDQNDQGSEGGIGIGIDNAAAAEGWVEVRRTISSRSSGGGGDDDDGGGGGGRRSRRGTPLGRS